MDKAIVFAANSLGVEPAALNAVVQTESNGVYYAMVDGKKEPLIRWEGHYFDRMVPAEKRAEARKAGLANPKAGAVKNPTSQAKRWDIFNRACQIDQDAAICSISMGFGQVMGAHWEKLGYKSPVDMLIRARSGFDGQLELMTRFIVKFGLLDELQRKDWSAFARGYNGPNYKQNSYDKELAKHYGTEVVPSSSGMLRLGSRGAKVRELQQQLVRLGYALKVDGDYGPSTKGAVAAFQATHELTEDGVAGPETQAAILKISGSETPKLSLLDVPEVKTSAAGAAGLAGLVAILNQLSQQLQPAVGLVPGLDQVVAYLTALAGVGAALLTLRSLWQAYRAGKTVEGMA